jgi:NADH:ubiquinone oxidoreductase subunit
MAYCRSLAANPQHVCLWQIHALDGFLGVDKRMATIGTLLQTWLNYKLVGTDEFGNRYYHAKGNALHGRQRRQVLYKGKPEASRVPAEWHSWLHHTTDDPLTELAVQNREWQKTHEANPTGTADAYRPRGHDLSGGRRAAATGDYEAWVPE